MDKEAEAYRDAIAFARAISNRDDVGATALVSSIQIEDILDLPIALAWLLIAAVTRIATLEGVALDVSWAQLIEVVEASVEPTEDDN